MIVELNLTGLCNLKCSFCPRAGDYANTNDHMTDDIIDKVIKSLMEFTSVRVHLSGHGEPTLHRNFDKVLNKLITASKKHNNMIIRLISNGHRVKKYIDSINQIHEFQWDVYSNNDGDFLDAISYCKENISKPLHYNITYRYDTGIVGGEYDSIYDKIIVKDRSPLTNRGGSAINDLISTIKIPGKGYCDRPFNKIFINWNGDFILCCEDWTDEALSNINDSSILEYFSNNNQLKTYKNALLSDKRIGKCSKCSYTSDRDNRVRNFD